MTPEAYERLKRWPFAPTEHHYSQRDTMLYALSIGLGFDPLDERALRYAHDRNLVAVPSMGVVLASLGFWIKDQDTGLDWKQVLHGEQDLEIHAPIPPHGTVVGQTRIDGIVDKGAGKGALIYSSREIRDRQSGRLLCTARQSSFCRGDGGFGGPGGPTWPVHALPDSEPALHCDLPTRPETALLYRLNGDFNPLHAEPAVAAAAGFARPILHGLCTFGVACHALLRTLLDYEAARLRRMQVRFSAPVFPGETIRTEIWPAGGVAHFRCLAVERNVVVINNGRAEYHA